MNKTERKNAVKSIVKKYNELLEEMCSLEALDGVSCELSIMPQSYNEGEVDRDDCYLLITYQPPQPPSERLANE